MREIKFRAFVKSLKWMLPVENINFSVKTVEVDLTSGNGDCSEYDFDDVEIMQSTGRKDMNEVDIYEGDLVKSGKRVMEVIWNKIGSGGWWYAETGRRHVHKVDLMSLKVVGNVHENPELI